jgi:hypothetical protein
MKVFAVTHYGLCARAFRRDLMPPELYHLVGVYVGRILRARSQPNYLSSSPQVSSW